MATGTEKIKLSGGVTAGPLFYSGLRPKKPYSTRLPGVIRRNNERLATPAWVDRQALRAFYTDARKLTVATGVRHSVDHVVPLRHPLVCGLHVPWNLRVTTLMDNCTKGNRFWPDMPEYQLTLFDGETV